MSFPLQLLGAGPTDSFTLQGSITNLRQMHLLQLFFSIGLSFLYNIFWSYSSLSSTLPISSPPPCVCCLSLHTNKTKKLKREKIPNKPKPWSLSSVAKTHKSGAWPGAWLTAPASLHWWELIFLLPAAITWTSASMFKKLKVTWSLAAPPLMRPQIISSTLVGFLIRTELFWNSGI